MIIQHTAIQLLQNAAATLEGLADDGVEAARLQWIAHRLKRAASRLQVEPLRWSDIRDADQAMSEVINPLESLRHGRHPVITQAWIDSACLTFNAVVDLIAAMQALQRVTLDQAAVSRPMGRMLRRLLPAGWGDRH